MAPLCHCVPSRRWQELDDAHKRAVIAQAQAEAAYRETQNKLSESERATEKLQREWKERHEVQRSRAAESHAARRRFPPRWIAPDKLEEWVFRPIVTADSGRS